MTVAGVFQTPHRCVAVADDADFGLLLLLSLPLNFWNTTECQHKGVPFLYLSAFFLEPEICEEEQTTRFKFLTLNPPVWFWEGDRPINPNRQHFAQEEKVVVQAKRKWLLPRACGWRMPETNLRISPALRSSPAITPTMPSSTPATVLRYVLFLLYASRRIRRESARVEKGKESLGREISLVAEGRSHESARSWGGYWKSGV